MPLRSRDMLLVERVLVLLQADCAPQPHLITVHLSARCDLLHAAVRSVTSGCLRVHWLLMQDTAALSGTEGRRTMPHREPAVRVVKHHLHGC